MPPTTTDESLRLTAAELQFAMETNQAVSRLFSAIAIHNRAIGRAAATAIASEDVAATGNLRSVLVLMTDSLEQLEQPLPATPPPPVES